MTARNKVIWSEGLFVKPQHFQQQVRYFEHVLHSQRVACDPHLYGLIRLSLREDLLTQGKVGLSLAKGVFSDGTPFDIPGEDLEPPILDIPEGFTANEIIYLCLPLQTEGGLEVQSGSGADNDVGARYQEVDFAVRDTTEHGSPLASVKVAQLRPVLKLGSQDLSSYSKLAIARIVEKKPDGGLVLDPSFYPTMLSLAAAPPLLHTLQELVEGVENRAKMISERIGKPGQTGVAEVSDFMLLQSLNRIGPYLRHQSQIPDLHPRMVFETLLQMVGELSTFLDERRLAPPIAHYDHDIPHKCWPELNSYLRQLISATLDSAAVPIKHKHKLHGYVVAPVPERSLIGSAEFILAVKANVPQERLHRDFATQAKVGSIETIRELVGKQVPGIPLRLMPVTPRQLPYHAGFSYFALERTASAWQQMERSEGFAFHIAGDFPELELQFWAIKG